MENNSNIIGRWCRRARLKLAIEKTQALVFRGEGDERHPTRFNIEGTRVQATKTVKGVILNKNLSCNNHIQSLAGKMNSIAKNIRGLSGDGWGAGFKQRLTYYHTVFLPTIVYAAPTWWNRPTKQIRRNIIQLQRPALLAILRAYRTVPTLGAQTLTACMPLDILLDARVAEASVRWPDRLCVEPQQDILQRLETSTTPTDKLTAIKNWTIEKWQHRWETGTTARHNFRLFPSIEQRLQATWIEPNYITTQLLTGHGNFSSKLHKFRRRDSPACPCGYPDEHADHIIKECPLYSNIRMTTLGNRTYNRELDQLITQQNQYKDFEVYWHQHRGEGPMMALSTSND